MNTEPEPMMPPPPLPNPPTNVEVSIATKQYRTWHDEHWMNGISKSECLFCETIVSVLSGTSVTEGQRAMDVWNNEKLYQQRLIREVNEKRDESAELISNIAVLTQDNQSKSKDIRKLVNTLRVWRDCIPTTMRQNYIDQHIGIGENGQPASRTNAVVRPPGPEVWDWRECVDYLTQEWVEDRLPPGLTIRIGTSTTDLDPEVDVDGVAARGWLLVHQFADWKTDPITFCTVILLLLETDGYRTRRIQERISPATVDWFQPSKGNPVRLNDLNEIVRRFAEAGIEDAMVWDAMHYARCFAEDFWTRQPNQNVRVPDIETIILQANEVKCDGPDPNGQVPRVHDPFWLPHRVFMQKKAEGTLVRRSGYTRRAPLQGTSTTTRSYHHRGRPEPYDTRGRRVFTHSDLDHRRDATSSYERGGRRGRGTRGDRH
jgi:hypothetical protein